MRVIFALIFMLGIQQLTFSQDTTKVDSVQALLKGKWKVYFVMKGSNVSEELLLELNNDKVAFRGDHKQSLYIFETDGKFRRESIQDYGSSSEKGTYTLSNDGSIIERNVIRANPWGKKELKKAQTIKTTILHIEKGKLVLKSKNKLIYLKRE